MECVGVAICFRHGSRGLVSSSASTLRKYDNNDQHALNERLWDSSEMEHLTEVGRAQMSNLGRYFGAKLLPRTASGALEDFKARPVKWRSSLVPRVIESGKCAMGGLRETTGASGIPSEPQPYSSNAEAEFTLRNWHVHEGYVAATAQLRTCDSMKSAALKVRQELDDLYGALTGKLPPGAPVPAITPRTAESVATELAGAAVTLNGIAADDNAIAEALDNDEDDDALARRLFQSTYICELWACESNWPATAVALSNGLIAPGDRAYGGGETFGATPAGPLAAGSVKATLLRRLSPENEAFMRKAARWVWEQRFLASPLTKPFGPTIGGALVREMLEDLAAATTALGAARDGRGGDRSVPRLALYSAHDYSLLSMLAALKVSAHPDKCVGFGSFIVLEAWRDAGAAGATGAAASGRGRFPGVSVTARMCTEPFPYAREGRPAELCAADTAVLFEGVSLESLLEMAQRWPAYVPPSTGEDGDVDVHHT